MLFIFHRSCQNHLFSIHPTVPPKHLLQCSPLCWAIAKADDVLPTSYRKAVSHGEVCHMEVVGWCWEEMAFRFIYPKWGSVDLFLWAEDLKSTLHQICWMYSRSLWGPKERVPFCFLFQTNFKEKRAPNWMSPQAFLNTFNKYASKTEDWEHNANFLQVRKILKSHNAIPEILQKVKHKRSSLFWFQPWQWCLYKLCLELACFILFIR